MIDLEDFGKFVIYILVIIILLMIIVGFFAYGKPILESIKSQTSESLIDIGKWLKP